MKARREERRREEVGKGRERSKVGRGEGFGERHPTQLDIQLSKRLSYQRHCTTEM